VDLAFGDVQVGMAYPTVQDLQAHLAWAGNSDFDLSINERLCRDQTRFLQLHCRNQAGLR